MAINAQTVRQARADGFSDDAILQHLAQKYPDIQRAINDGVTPSDIIKHILERDLTNTIDANRQAKLDEIKNQLAKNESEVKSMNSTSDDVIRGAAQGATLGFNDEISGGVKSFINNSTYQSEVAAERLRNEMAKKNSPIAYGVAEFAASTPISIASGGVGNGLKASAAAGGILGAIQGFGAGEGTEDSLKSAATGGVIGGTLGGVMSKPVFDEAGRVINAVRNPISTANNNVISKSIESSADKLPEQLADNKFMQGLLTPAQQSSSKLLGKVEQFLRESPQTADKVFEFDKKQADVAQEGVQEFIDRVGNSKSSGILGSDIQKAISEKVRKLDIDRDMNWNKNYEVVQNLAPAEPFIEPKNVVSVLEDLAQEGKRAVDPQSDTKKIGERAAKMLESLSSENGSRLLDLKEARTNQQIWSKGSQQKGSLLDSLTSTDLDQVTSSRLASALNDDIENAAKSINNTELSNALKQARNQYTSDSNNIKAIKLSSLSRLLGKDIADNLAIDSKNTVASETVVKKFKNLQPTEVQDVMKVLNEIDPELQRTIRASMIQDSLEKARDVAPTAAAAGYNVSFNKFIKELPDEKKLKALGFSDNELTDIKDISRTLVKIADRSNANFSNTDIRKETAGVIDTLSRTAAGSVSAVVGFLAKKAFLDRMADVMTDPQGLSAMRQLTDIAKQVEVSGVEAAQKGLSKEDLQAITKSMSYLNNKYLINAPKVGLIGALNDNNDSKKQQK